LFCANESERWIIVGVCQQPAPRPDFFGRSYAHGRSLTLFRPSSPRPSGEGAGVRILQNEISRSEPLNRPKSCQPVRCPRFSVWVVPNTLKGGHQTRWFMGGGFELVNIDLFTPALSPSGEEGEKRTVLVSRGTPGALLAGIMAGKAKRRGLVARAGFPVPPGG
jgi:hypothetical protein